LLRPHGGIFYGSEELLMLLLDVETGVGILIRVYSTEISQVNISVHDSKVGRFNVSVQKAQLMKLLDHFKHLNCR